MSKTTNRFSPGVHVRAVRLVLDHEKEHSSRWAEVFAIAAKIGRTAQTLNEWVKKAEMDSCVRAGLSTAALSSQFRDREPISDSPRCSWRRSPSRIRLPRGTGEGGHFRPAALSQAHVPGQVGRRSQATTKGVIPVC